jgi:hypothetical protein
LSEQGAEHALAMSELKGTLSQNQIEFEQALGAKTEHTKEQVLIACDILVTSL